LGLWHDVKVYGYTPYYISRNRFIICETSTFTDDFATMIDPRSDDFRKRNYAIASRLAQANYKTSRERL